MKKTIIFIKKKSFYCSGNMNNNWDSHPKVFLIFHNKKSICPYCGNIYKIIS